MPLPKHFPTPQPVSVTYATPLFPKPTGHINILFKYTWQISIKNSSCCKMCVENQPTRSWQQLNIIIWNYLTILSYKKYLNTIRRCNLENNLLAPPSRWKFSFPCKKAAGCQQLLGNPLTLRSVLKAPIRQPRREGCKRIFRPWMLRVPPPHFRSDGWIPILPKSFEIAGYLQGPARRG